MNLRGKPELAEKLAAEYVLGTLRGGARRRFEAWMRVDAVLRATALRWHDRLAALAELGPPVTPPARVWKGIERRLRHGPRVRWWQLWRADAVRPWAGIALTASAATLVLAVLLVMRTNAPADATQQVAALTDAQARTALVVTADTRHGRLDVRLARDVRVPDDRTLQLWAIDRAGKPRSLGILPGARGAELALDQRAVGPDVVLLAISLEPKGGSPNPDAPTGPVLYKGSWTRL